MSKTDNYVPTVTPPDSPVSKVEKRPNLTNADKEAFTRKIDIKVLFQDVDFLKKKTENIRIALNALVRKHNTTNKKMNEEIHIRRKQNERERFIDNKRRTKKSQPLLSRKTQRKSASSSQSFSSRDSLSEGGKRGKKTLKKENRKDKRKKRK